MFGYSPMAVPHVDDDVEMVQPRYSTTEPVPSPPTRLARMDVAERGRIRTAALRAKRVYPGAVGELLYNELMFWEHAGYKFGGHVLFARIVDEIMNATTG